MTHYRWDRRGQRDSRLVIQAGVHRIRGDVFSFCPDVFTFRANVFIFRPDVFIFRPNVFSEEGIEGRGESSEIGKDGEVRSGGVGGRGGGLRWD